MEIHGHTLAQREVEMTPFQITVDSAAKHTISSALRVLGHVELASKIQRWPNWPYDFSPDEFRIIVTPQELSRVIDAYTYSTTDGRKFPADAKFRTQNWADADALELAEERGLA